jgi:hypothetical protein
VKTSTVPTFPVSTSVPLTVRESTNYWFLPTAVALVLVIALVTVAAKQRRRRLR